MCGLGLVISEVSKAGLDTSKPFIDIIPENKMNDISYVESVIQKNRKVSNSMRKEIRDYALQEFDWTNIVKKYTDTIENIITNE